MTAKLRAYLLGTLVVVAIPMSAMAQGKQDDALLRRVEMLERRSNELERRVRELESTAKAEQPRAQPVAPSRNAREIANWRRLRNGMSMSEVREILGEPERIETVIQPTWSYAGGAQVLFGRGSQKVDGWSEPRR